MTERADQDQTTKTNEVPESTEQTPEAEAPVAAGAGLARPARVRRGHLPRALLAILVLIAIAAVAFAAYSFLWKPSPERIFADMLATYKGAKCFTAEATMTIEMDIGGSQVKSEVPLSMAYLGPNLLYLEYAQGMQASKTVCDGENIYMEVGFFKKAVSAPAPDGLTDLPTGATMGVPGGGQTGLFDLEALAQGDAQSELVESVQAGVDKESEWLSGLPQPGGCWAITVTPKEGPPVALWVARRSHLLRQMAMEMSAEDMAGGRELPEELSEGPDGQLAEMFKNMKYRMVLTASKTSVTEPPPKEKFQYTPPAGMEVVEAENVADMTSALMGASMGDMPSMPKKKNLEGEVPPDFTGQDLHGKSGSFSSFKGRPLVLDFWSTWCPPCLKEMPILEEIYGALHDQGLEIVAVSTDTSIEVVKEFCREHPVSFRVIWLTPERAREVTEAYGITGIPRTLYITEDWKVQADTTGLHSKSKMLDHIEELGIDTSAAR